jgi:hypothetical protein
MFTTPVTKGICGDTIKDIAQERRENPRKRGAESTPKTEA